MGPAKFGASLLISHVSCLRDFRVVVIGVWSAWLRLVLVRYDGVERILRAIGLCPVTGAFPVPTILESTQRCQGRNGGGVAYRVACSASLR
jgi:hypothetical protein